MTIPPTALAFWLALVLAFGLACGYGIRASSHPDVKTVVVKHVRSAGYKFGP